MIILERSRILFGTLHNPGPYLFILDVFEILDTVTVPISEELIALYWKTINQVGAATDASRFALD